MLLLLSLLTACGDAPQAAPEASALEPAQDKTAPGLAQELVVQEPRIRMMPPGAPNTGAFMTLKNPGPDSALVAAHADISRAVELHTHVSEGGVMRMRQVPEIALPSGEPVVLEPGGLHVMFIGLKAPLSEGQQVPVRLELADGSSVEVIIPVRKIEVGH